MSKEYITCLSIAGHDPSGGAGIEADLKTFSALGVYGTAAITAITLQNTLGVEKSIPVDAEIVSRQAELVIQDLRPQSIKIGMVCNEEIIHHLAALFSRYHHPCIIFDPVIVSSSGKRLLENSAISALKKELLPFCDLLTPNLSELRLLSGINSLIDGAKLLIDRYGVKGVLIKGGHSKGEPIDTLVSRDACIQFPGQRIHTTNDHGTGCTLSAAIAAHCAMGYDIPTSIHNAKIYLQQALSAGADINIGHGHGPMNHFFNPRPLQIKEK